MPANAMVRFDRVRPRCYHRSRRRLRHETDTEASVGKHKNTVIVQAIFGAFLRGDIPAILDKLDDDVEWVINELNDAVPTFGTYKGKDEVLKFFELLAQDEDFQVFDPNEYIAQYDKVISFVHAESTVKKTGKTIKQDVVMSWTLKDRKVTKLRVYDDTAASIAAYSP